MTDTYPLSLFVFFSFLYLSLSLSLYSPLSRHLPSPPITPFPHAAKQAKVTEAEARAKKEREAAAAAAAAARAHAEQKQETGPSPRGRAGSLQGPPPVSPAKAQRKQQQQADVARAKSEREAALAKAAADKEHSRREKERRDALERERESQRKAAELKVGSPVHTASDWAAAAAAAADEAQADGKQQQEAKAAAAAAAFAAPAAQPYYAGGGLDSDAVFAQMMESCVLNQPRAADSSMARPYVPAQPATVPAAYPAARLSHITPDVVARFDVSLLFFIFFFESDTYVQSLVVAELKNQSWRYHKKYQTWFMRHAEPTFISDTYEQGSYVYYDTETNATKLRDSFVFNYSELAS